MWCSGPLFSNSATVGCGHAGLMCLRYLISSGFDAVSACVQIATSNQQGKEEEVYVIKKNHLEFTGSLSQHSRHSLRPSVPALPDRIAALAGAWRQYRSPRAALFVLSRTGGYAFEPGSETRIEAPWWRRVEISEKLVALTWGNWKRERSGSLSLQPR
jgi:hypothetical protein